MISFETQHPMIKEFMSNEHFDRTLLSPSHQDIWIKTSSDELKVIAQRPTSSTKDVNARLDSSANIKNQISIGYFYGCKGNGTLIMNTWIVLAKYLFFDKSTANVSGMITETNGVKLKNLIEFYEKFGFKVQKSEHYFDHHFSAKLCDLQPVQHKSKAGKDYFYQPFMFSDGGSLLSNEIASLNKPISLL